MSEESQELQISHEPKEGLRVQDNSPEGLIALAIEKNADIDKLERLMALKERYDKQLAESEFNVAFAEFQSKKPELINTKDVIIKGEKRYSYLPLQKIQKKIDPVLSSCGLSYSWIQKEDSGKIQVTCVLKHVKGHEIKTSLSSDPDTSGSKNTIQSLGSANSYLKRYTLTNLLGLSADEDDDTHSTTPTKEEIEEMQYEKLDRLYNENEHRFISNSIKERVREILNKKESSAYSKVIRTFDKYLIPVEKEESKTETKTDKK